MKAQTAEDTNMSTTADTDRITRSVVDRRSARARLARALERRGIRQLVRRGPGGPDLRARAARARAASRIAGYEHVWFDVVVERIEPKDLLSYRWHPYAMDPAIDY